MVDHLSSIIPAFVGLVLMIISVSSSNDAVSYSCITLGFVLIGYGMIIHSNNVARIRRRERN